METMGLRVIVGESRVGIKGTNGYYLNSSRFAHVRDWLGIRKASVSCTVD